jgi:arylformamidase
MLYRGMDRAQRDIAYNNTLAVPERGEIVADWAARSDLMRQKYGGVLDLRCGHPARAARLVSRRRPEGADAGLHPLRLLAGERQGGLRFPGRGDIVARDFALIEYTLPPAARLDRIVAEIRRAALWLAEHLGDYGADPGELYVSGHSAGGYLTAMTMPLDLVRGGIAISGIYDLEPIRLNYLNERLGLSPAEADRNSPLLHFPPQAAELVIA